MDLESMRCAMSMSMPSASTFLQLISSSNGLNSLWTCTESARAFVWRSRSREAFTRSCARYSRPTVSGKSVSVMASRSEPSRTTNLMCISALPRSLSTLWPKAFRLVRTACRKASSVSNTVPNRKGRTVPCRKQTLTTRACSSTDFSLNSPLLRSYSLTITANSPLGYPSTEAPLTPCTPSSMKGRRERVPLERVCNSVRQYAYHAMQFFLRTWTPAKDLRGVFYEAWNFESGRKARYREIRTIRTSQDHLTSVRSEER